MRRPDCDRQTTIPYNKAQDDDLVMSLVQLAFGQRKEKRERYLRSACAQDSELFKEVSKYVEWEERMNGFLLDPLCTQPSSDINFKPSELVENRFRIVREVARGGMGIVYEAVDEKLGRRIAIKCAKPGFRRWLPREVRHASEIGHPSVCRIFEIHTVPTERGEIDFLTMEFLEGETLAERLQRGPIPQNEARAIAEQLCGGLAEAHRTGVIHGDLKSNNVILATAVDGTVRAVITDFGLARGCKANLGTIQSGTLRGTPDYMAPELWKGEKASVASDIYALGVILYELVAGHRPFVPEVSHQDRVIRKAPPAKWDRILAKCLDPDPLRRFANAAGVGRALEKHSRRRFLWAAAAMAAAVAGVLGHIWGGPAENAIPSVAVLPFANAHGTPDIEFLSDGISEALINNLSQLPGLKVIARSSSFRFRPPGGNVRNISQALNAQALVAGSIAENAGRLRIAVELINADGAQIWGEQYTPTNSDLAAVQARISHDIAERIRVKLLPGEQALLSKWANTKPGAYELLLRGRYHFRLYSAESRQKMISYYEQALAIDPAFALANAELAYSLRSLSGGGIASPDDVMVRAEAAAQRALAADANLAEGHLALAEIKKDRWDWDTAGREYQRALELNPNLAEAHMGYAIFLSVTGKYEAARAEIRRTRELDPIGLPAAIHEAAVEYNERHYDQALVVLQKAVKSDPLASAAWSWTGLVNAGAGRFAEAIPAYEKAIAQGDDTGATACYYAYSLARSGSPAKALGILTDLHRSKRFAPSSAVGAAYLGLNEKERAIQLLQQAYAARDPLLQYLKVESHFDSLQNDPRYQELAAKMGLPRVESIRRN